MIRKECIERTLILEWDAPPVNVLDGKLLGEIAAAVREASRDSNLSALILRGAGKGFSAGASVGEHARESAPAMLEALTDACQSLTEVPFPVIAQVHGMCLGGGLELALFADFIVADPDARLGVPEIQLAFYPPLALSALPARVGFANAAWMVLSGEVLDAARARDLGLVQEMHPRERWIETAQRYNALSGAALRLAKSRTRAAFAPLLAAARAENQVFLKEIYALNDPAEGMRAFAKREKPHWQHA